MSLLVALDGRQQCLSGSHADSEMKLSSIFGASTENGSLKGTIVRSIRRRHLLPPAPAALSLSSTSTSSQVVGSSQCYR